MTEEINVAETTLTKIKKTCTEMFMDRGYTICTTITESNEEEDEVFLSAKKSNGKRVLVYFIRSVKLNISTFMYYFGKMKRDEVDHSVFIYYKDITSSVKKLLAEHMHEYTIELFTMKELTFNLTKHRLVPLHERVNAKEHKEINKYPIIRRTDPVVRYYLFNPGSLIRIRREDKTVYFRVVR